MLGMTKAMYYIKTTFKEMVDLHQKEVNNHQKLIDSIKKAAEKEKNHEKKLVYLLEASRNREHQKSHEHMIDIYKYLKGTL